MSKELEALKELRSYCGDVYYNVIYDKDYQIIESALKRLEGYENHTTFTMVNQINALRDENEELRKRLNEMYELREQYHLDQKKLKALAIIKEREWFDDFMKEHLTREWFTKDELDLLKEVL